MKALSYYFLEGEDNWTNQTEIYKKQEKQQ